MRSTTFMTIIIMTIMTAVTGSTNLAFHTVSLCPYAPAKLASYTNSLLSTTSTTWASQPLKTTQTCSTPLTPGSQSIIVDSLSRAQHNIDQWVPRSSTYALSVFRSTSITSTFLDFEIVDATKTTIVPRMQLTLKEHSSSSTRRSKRNPRGRRKGKGGIGGGGRYGGGAGGFRTASPTGPTKTYGYSSKAINNRFAPGYSQESYGYSGRSMIFVGAPLYLHGRGHYSNLQCDRYAGEARSRCRHSYTCYSNGTRTSTSCQYRATAMIRDDLMAATVHAKNISFPLIVTFHKAAVVFAHGVQPVPWQEALMFSFSEVDFDDVEDPLIAWWAFCLMLSMPVLLCCCFCCFFCMGRRHAHVSDEMMMDLENPKNAVAGRAVDRGSDPSPNITRCHHPVIGAAIKVPVQSIYLTSALGRHTPGPNYPNKPINAPALAGYVTSTKHQA